ncbi:MAG TPA: YkvA family protein [Micromonosporaceae bacterium]|nr:YkvA family protein [Micromonosporaceae bacterium]
MGLGACWLALLGLLVVVRPRGAVLTEAVRLLPDLIRLTARLAREPALGRGVCWRLGLLAGYLAFPFDLIPDVIPVLGYADDAILVVWTLRSVVRHAGVDVIRRHWPGSDHGYRAVLLLCGIADRSGGVGPTEVRSQRVR